MKASLTARLQDIPGVAQVVVDLDETSGGIHVKLQPGADEDAVLEKMRGLLVAYGLRPREGRSDTVGRQQPQETAPEAVFESSTGPADDDDLGVDVTITPIVGGARVEVAGEKVRSFRVVKPTPLAIVHGVAEAWCQVVGRAPFNVTGVTLDDGDLVVSVRDGEVETTGRAAVSEGWSDAIPRAVGLAGDLIGAVPPPLAVNS